jgi:hypothetical protein
MSGPDDIKVPGVRPHEDRADLKDSVDLDKEAILALGRRHMVQHRKAGGRRETVRVQARLGGVGTDHVDVGARQSFLERYGQGAVHLKSGEAGYPLTQKIGRQARTGSDLQDVVTKVTDGLHPGQQVRFQHGRPLWAGKED